MAGTLDLRPPVALSWARTKRTDLASASRICRHCQTELPQRRIAAALALLALSIVPSYAAGGDIVPLQHGYYVRDTTCNNASRGSLELFLGNSFGVNCSINRIENLGNNTFRITETCDDSRGDRKFTSTNVYQIINRTEFLATFSLDETHHENHYRYCPQSSLPEPWRSIKKLGP
jgi:hypothetical protein